jgi:hypothetical protein
MLSEQSLATYYLKKPDRSKTITADIEIHKIVI